MSRSRILILACSTAMALALAGPLTAQEAPKLAERAKQALQKGDAAGAYDLFLKAHKAQPADRNHVHNAASLANVLGKTDEAAGLFIKAAALAAKANAAEDLALYRAEIAKLREAVPGAEERMARASVVPEGKQNVVAIWDRMRQTAIRAHGAGDMAKAAQAIAQAVNVARDNLGDGHVATIFSLSDQGAILSAADQPAEAEAAFAAALERATAALGATHPETLKIRSGIANHFAQRAEWTKAAAAWQDHVREASALGESHGLVLHAQTQHARVLANAGKYAEADALLAPVCAARARLYGESHPQTGKCLAQHAATARKLGEVAEAASRIDRALAIDPADMATRLEAAGIRMDQGRHADARTLLEGVIRDAEAAKDAITVQVARGELVDAMVAQGQFDEAERLAKAVLDEQTRVLGDLHPNTVATLTSVAGIYRGQGRLAEAEAAFKDAHDRFAKVLGQDHRSTIVAANNLGEILEKQGLFDLAEPYLRAAADNSRKAFGEANPTTLISLNNLALLYESQGNFDKAEALYQSVIAAFTRSLGAKHPDTAAFVNNLAYLYLLKEDFAKAEPMFRQVHEAWSAAYGPRHINTLKAANNLARVLHKQGKLAEAEPLFDKTLAMRRQVLGERHMDVLRSQHDLAALYRSAKRLDQAEALLEKTLKADEQVLGPLHPYTFETLNTLAAVKEEKNDLKGALKVRETTFARRNEFLNRMLYVTGDNAREGYVRLHQPELAAYADLLARVDGETAGRGLLEISLNRKGLLFKVASELAQIGRLSKDPELARMGDELTEARKKLAALTLSGPTEETKGRHLDVLHGLEERIEVLQGELGRASARFRKTVKPIAVDELVTGMPDDGVLVDFVQFTKDGKQRLVAATLRKDSGKPVFGLIAYPDLDGIEKAIQKYRKDIQDEEIDLDDMLDTGAATYEIIWKPLEKTVAGKDKVFVVPDGMLNILPFAALVDKNRKYLIEKTDLHIYTTSRNLLPNALPPARGGYIINAGPDYNNEDVAGESRARARSSRAGSPVQDSMRGMGSGMRGMKFDPLPGAEKEGVLIRDKVVAQGGRSTMFAKRDAQEKVLRELAEPPEILHIATHGFFLKADDNLRKRLLKLQRGGDMQLPPPGDNPLLRSGLAFAGINANAQFLGEVETDNDGVLTALEVLSLNLTGTKLAILSACETGLGEVHEGEGVYGLRRAFQEAGASTVVSSLWEVSDAGTQRLMTSLYGRLLKGQTPHDALRDAQLEMLRIGEWSSPYIWSAFFMVDG